MTLLGGNMDYNDLQKLIDDFTFDDYIEFKDKIVSIDEHNLELELVKIADLHSTCSDLFSIARMDLTNAQNNLEILTGELKLLAATSLVEAGKKATANNIDAMVTSDHKRETLLNVLSHTEYKVNLFKGLVKSIEIKKDALIQLSSNKRQEAKIYS